MMITDDRSLFRWRDPTGDGHQEDGHGKHGRDCKGHLFRIFLIPFDNV